jgi:hypothetical protein
MKLRIDYIDEDITPCALRGLFESFGSVDEVAIYAGGDLVYGVVDMPEEDADRVILSRRGVQWRGQRLHVEVANRSRRPWLSPDWRPPRDRSL